MGTTTFAPTPPPPEEEGTPASEETNEAIDAEVVSEESIPEAPPSGDQKEAAPVNPETSGSVEDEVDAPDEASDPPEENFALPAPTDLTNTSGFVGEYDEQDFQLHRIHLAQRIGDLGEMFEPGSIVLDQETEILGWNKKEAKSEDPGYLECVIILAQKFYQEDIPWSVQQEENTQPRVFHTKDEVVSNGGSFVKGAAARFFPGLRLLLMVKAPNQEDYDPDIFTETVGDEKWAMCSFMLRKTAYYECGAKIIGITKRKTTEGQPIHICNHVMHLTVGTKRIQENNVFVPRFKIVSGTPTEMIEQITAVL